MSDHYRLHFQLLHVKKNGEEILEECSLAGFRTWEGAQRRFDQITGIEAKRKKLMNLVKRRLRRAAHRIARGKR